MDSQVRLIAMALNYCFEEVFVILVRPFRQLGNRYGEGGA
jgi:hypothetical protein